MPSYDEFVTYCQNFVFKIRRDRQKIPNEHRDHESVDKKSLSSAVFRKTTKKIIQTVKGLDDIGDAPVVVPSRVDIKLYHIYIYTLYIPFIYIYIYTTYKYNSYILLCLLHIVYLKCAYVHFDVLRT